MIKFFTMIGAALLAIASVWADAANSFFLQCGEFAKYHRLITGRGAPEGAARFAIDPNVSKSGRDAYRIVSCDGGKAVAITGSNLRSVWYGLYDLLERRGGCHWFWDGDVVPKKDTIDLSGLDVYEEAHFEYRAIRYFAHRGLTRFQAEHWGLDDWKKEIDWLLKRRLNTFMLRIGQDDVFQRTFPDVCPYPDASKPQPGMYKGYNDRTLFWSLQFRGQLRRDLQKYAFDRGLMSPEDFGTMSHWYSPTPDAFLANKKPPFLPQSNSTHAEPHLRVWDIRTGDWAEEYWKLTKTAIDAYDQGAPEPRLLHTIGLGERRCYKDRKANFDLKVKTLNQFLDIAKRDYPDAKLLIAGWDFYNSWSNEEVRDYLKTLDKDRVILWDYEADHASRGATARNFTNWDVIGKFPYTYSVFLAYEKALDARANYPIIEERQRLVQDDPFCKGYVFWPESSHTDTLLLRFFTANAWAAKPIPHGDVLDEFCASRYGANAELMKAAWKAALPASWLRDWGNNYSAAVLGIGSATHDLSDLIDKWKQPVEDAQKVFTLLQGVPWDDPFVRRDAIDIARMVLDRLIAVRVWEFSQALTKWRKGEPGTTGVSPVESTNGQDARSPSDLLARINAVANLCDRMADLIALHTDYSLWESYQRLDAVEKIRNPLFEKTLFENASCGYCRSHQYELARHWYAPHVRAVADRLAKAVAAGDRKAAVIVNAEQERLALKAKPLESLKPTLPRTEGNFRKTLCAVASMLAAQTSAEIGMDLYLLIGQSNMAGRGKLTTDNRVDTDRIFKLDAKGQWQVADEPIHFDKKVAGAGLSASFARTMADRDKGVKIGLIPCAVGGTRIERWIEGGDLWSNAVARTRIALKSGTLKGILWHQGEGDADPSRAPVWGAKLESVVKSLRREFGNVPFVAGELGWYLENFKAKGRPAGYRPLWREINAQLHELEGKVPNFRAVSAKGLGANRDKLHFSTEALREFGRRYAAAFEELGHSEKSKEQ